VEWLASALDALPTTGSESAKLKDVFSTVARYEYAFWDGVYRGEDWPV
jgi:thiaminase